MVYVVVVISIQHGLEIVIVGNRELHRVRVCLTHVALSVVRYVVIILIPVHRCVVVDILLTVAMQVSISFVAVYLPSATDEFVSSRCYLRLVHTHCSARQYCCWWQQHVDDRCTTLKLDVNIDDVHLVDECCLAAVVTTLIVGVLIHHRDNLLLREILNVAFAANIEGRRFCWLFTLDEIVQLVVLQLTKIGSIDNPARFYSCTTVISSSTINYSTTTLVIVY